MKRFYEILHRIEYEVIETVKAIIDVLHTIKIIVFGV